jgi:hypothetical protein
MASLQSFLDPRSTIPAWITKLQIGLTVFKLVVVDGAILLLINWKTQPLACAQISCPHPQTPRQF